MSEQDVTICAKCKHSENKQDGPRTKVWYNWFCCNPKAERPLGIDPVTGDTCHFEVNSLGETHACDEAFPNCRSLNKGYCPMWESGTPKLSVKS